MSAEQNFVLFIKCRLSTETELIKSLSIKHLKSLNIKFGYSWKEVAFARVSWRGVELNDTVNQIDNVMQLLTKFTCR